FGFKKDEYDKVLQSLAVVLKPEFRGTHMTQHYLTYSRALISEMGPDYMFLIAGARDIMGQKLALKAGYKIGGIMPGAFRLSYDGKTYCRDMILYMYRFLNGSERYTTHPKDWRLAEQVSQYMSAIGY